MVPTTDYLGQLYRQVVDVDHDVHPLFRRRPYRSLRTLGQWTWIDDDKLDLEYHVRHSALPKPGRIRELLALSSRLHGSLLDRNRPLWEAHLIEGVEGRQFAVYTKIHHAVVDGVAALRLLQDSLSEDVNDRDMAPPWAMPRRHRSRPGVSVPSPLGVAGTAVKAVGETVGVGRALLRSVQDAMADQAASLPFQAPHTMFNVPITGARRFAADSWDLDRIKIVGKAAGATLNDVVLAMCAGALRSYLLDQGELPDQPLVSMVPVALRSSEAAADAGNAVGAVLCNLATDVEDAGERLARISASMKHAKERMQELSPTQMVAVSAFVVGGMALGPLTGGRMPRPPFNLVISNVPGPRNPLYWNGARLDGQYPLSIPADGQALNITVVSYVNHLEFGLTGCRRTVPHLQRLLADLEGALVDLEAAVA